MQKYPDGWHDYQKATCSFIFEGDTDKVKDRMADVMNFHGWLMAATIVKVRKDTKSEKETLEAFLEVIRLDLEDKIKAIKEEDTPNFLKAVNPN